LVVHRGQKQRRIRPLLVDDFFTQALHCVWSLEETPQRGCRSPRPWSAIGNSLFGTKRTTRSQTSGGAKAQALKCPAASMRSASFRGPAART
jgi:hypothetical protein